MNHDLERLVEELRREEQILMEGGGPKAIVRQHEKGRLTARERIARLLDVRASFFELGLWAAWGMYRDWGEAPSAGVVTGIGSVAGRRVMVIANDATVKAGAFFPLTAKKVLRAQRIALDNRLPLIYLVDSAGVFLPLQDEVFPDEGDADADGAEAEEVVAGADAALGDEDREVLGDHVGQAQGVGQVHVHG